MSERKEIIKIQEFPNGVNRIHIPVLSPEEEKERQKRIHDAGARLLRAQIACHAKKEGPTV